MSVTQAIADWGAQTNEDLVYTKAQDAFTFNAEQMALLKSLTAPSTDPTKDTYTERLKTVLSTANDLTASIGRLNRADYKSAADYQKALYDQYNYDTGNKGALVSSLSKTATLANAQNNLNADTSAFSLIDFFKQKFNLVTLAFVLIAIFLFFIGAKNLSGNVTSQVKGAFK